MKSKSTLICETAVRLFKHYGVKRTSMNDIAKEAGIARQTLYNLFQSKDEIVSASIRYYTDNLYKAAREKILEAETPKEKLNVIYDYLVRRPYNELCHSPHLNDIFDGVSQQTKKTTLEWGLKFTTLFYDTLKPYEKEIALSKMTINQLSEAARYFGVAAKHEARDHEHLEELLQSLTNMILRCISA